MKRALTPAYLKEWDKSNDPIEIIPRHIIVLPTEELTKPRNARAQQLFTILQCWNNGFSPDLIADIHDISRSSVYRLIGEIEAFGCLDMPNLYGRDAKLASLILDKVSEIGPQTSRQLFRYLRSQRVKASIRYVHRVLRKAGYRLRSPMKFIHGDDEFVAESREKRCKELQTTIEDAEKEGRKVIYFDESLFQQSDLSRRAKLWSPDGAPVILNDATELRSQNVCVIPFYSSEKLEHCSVTSGYADASVIYRALEFILKHKYPTGCPPLFICDNASIHRAKMLEPLKQPAEDRQQILDIQYLPPYSPWLNPVEYCFSRLKTYLGSHLAGVRYRKPDTWKASLESLFYSFEQRNFDPSKIFAHVKRMYELTIEHKGYASAIYSHYHQERKSKNPSLPTPSLFKTVHVVE